MKKLRTRLGRDLRKSRQRLTPLEQDADGKETAVVRVKQYAAKADER